MYTQRILLHGHIIDSLTLPKTMDTIIDQGGDYEIEELQVGKLKTDKSTAKLIVKSDDEEIFNRILDILTDYGAELIEENEEVTLVASQKIKLYLIISIQLVITILKLDMMENG